MQFPDFHQLVAGLKADVYDLCLEEGRTVGSKGHNVAREFLLSRLDAIGCQPYSRATFEHRYTGDQISSSYSRVGKQAFTNLLGVVPGKDRNLSPVLIGAHYDSVVEAPCADDNGAAVAICLALAAAAVGAGGLRRDLVIAFFDAEEPPYFLSDCMGSNRFYADQMDDRGVHFALIYDLVGHDITLPGEYIPLLNKLPRFEKLGLAPPGLRNLLFMTGAESSPTVKDLVASIEVPNKLSLVATLNDYVGDMSDHGVFRRNNVPYLFLSCGRWQHYHQPSDTPDRLNYKKMARIVQLSTSILEKVAGSNTLVAATEDHTVEYEIETIKAGFGLLLPVILKSVGLSKLKTREDIRKLVIGLMSLGI